MTSLYHDKANLSSFFILSSTEYYDIQINDLILEVQVRGNPPPTIKWFRDGIELDDTEGDKFFQLREPEGIHKLTIHDPQIKDQGRYMCEATNIAGKDSIKHELRKFNKDSYTHVYGISHYDPSVMKHGVYEEPQEVVEREHREVIFLEDGTYYLRGQTPEHLWEFETDTSAESEYEPYEPTSEDEKEENEEDEDEDDEKEADDEKVDDKTKESSEQETNKEVTETDEKADADDEDEEELPEQPKPAPVIKRGPKIKKMRKKNVYKQKQSTEPKLLEQQHLTPEQEQVSESKDEEKTIPHGSQPIEPICKEEQVPVEEPDAQPSESVPEQATVPKDKDTLRKERYLRLFPELVPVPPKPEESKNALKFIAELRDITVAEGKPAKLFCTVLGPKPDIKWLKDGEPMEFTKTIKNLSQDGTGIVTFAKVCASDSGIYTAVVKNKEHRITSQAKLTVAQKSEARLGMGPRFITNIEQHYDFRVDDLILETHIKGDGLLMVQWFLDGLPIENNEKYIQIREPMGVYKLCIHNPQVRDNGNYTIKVTNDFGTEEQKYHLRFEGKTGKPSYGIFHADPRRQYADEEVVKEPRQYREVVFLEDGTYYVRGHTPEQFWEWETDTSAESEYEEYVSDGEQSVATEEEEEEKEAIEEPSADSIPVVEQEEIQNMKEDPGEAEAENDEDEYVEPEKPKVIKRGPKIKKMRKKVTKPATEAAPVPVVQPKIATKPEVRPSGEGQPKMRISQRIASGQPQEAPAPPKPKRKPIEVEFISHLRNQTLLKGKTLSLNCCCSDNQKVEVQWFKDGEKFEMNKRCVSDVHFGFVTLEIYRTTVEDSGIYECHVKTANGEAKDSCKITVFELPGKDVVELVPPTFIHPLRGK